MYELSVPVMVTSKAFDKEKILADLRLAGAKRVFLAIGALTTNEEKQNEIFLQLERAINFFKNNGIETGVWFWAFMVKGNNSFTPITGFSKAVSSEQKCPLDENFLRFMSDKIQKIAKMRPDLIMFDDDLRLGFLDSGCGCICEKHRAAMQKILHKDVPSDGLFDKMFSTGKNEYRSAYLEAAGESLKNFCFLMREAADRGAGKDTVRLGACSCMSVWDTDGVDSYTLAKILAGTNKPFVRLIGAPYWASEKNWGNRLPDVIEIERMERSWYAYDNIEIFSEADCYPRPRYRVPAAYLEIFDTALRADGKMSGILKYMFDYTSSQTYERGYLDKHIDNFDIYAKISELFGNKADCGVRVYEFMNKLEEADFSEIKVSPEYIQNMFFPVSARVLAANTIPSVYTESGCAGIAFGENARHLPKSAFEKPLIIDIQAAKILTESGIDVGLESVGKAFSPMREFYPKFGEYTSIYEISPFAFEIEVKDTAVIESVFETNDNSTFPACYSYSGVNGNFIVYTFRGDIAKEEVWRNYCRPRQIAEILKKFNANLPFECYGNPDMYTICKQDNVSMAIGLWNCHADYASNLKLKTSVKYKKATFISCDGKFAEDEVIIDRIGAYEYAFILLEK